MLSCITVNFLEEISGILKSTCDEDIIAVQRNSLKDTCTCPHSLFSSKFKSKCLNGFGAVMCEEKSRCKSEKHDNRVYKIDGKVNLNLHI